SKLIPQKTPHIPHQLPFEIPGHSDHLLDQGATLRVFPPIQGMMAQGRGPKTPSIHQEEWAKFENDIFKRAKDHLRCVVCGPSLWKYQGGGGNLDRDGLRKAQVECQKCGKKPTLRAALGLGAVDNPDFIQEWDSTRAQFGVAPDARAGAIGASKPVEPKRTGQKELPRGQKTLYGFVQQPAQLLGTGTGNGESVDGFWGASDTVAICPPTSEYTCRSHRRIQSRGVPHHSSHSFAWIRRRNGMELRRNVGRWWCGSGADFGTSGCNFSTTRRRPDLRQPPPRSPGWWECCP
ncbi:hypothetical protein M427DRAFT_501889, partial [Gonapodya prolifera JEL478]